jgi:nicotinate-nucleotide adenylyltransferase
LIIGAALLYNDRFPGDFGWEVNDRETPLFGKLNQGYYFGTFNPVHNGHFVMADTARKLLGLERVVFVPAYAPPHKQGAPDMASFEARCAMLERAVQGKPYFSVSRVECELPSPSYTIQTLRKLFPNFDRPTWVEALSRFKPLAFLKKWFPDAGRIPFILGSDEFNALSKWRDAPALARKLLFYVVRRNNEKLIPEITVGTEKFPLRYREFKLPVGAVLPQLSSTLVRERARLNQPLADYVPDGVEAYIQQNNLYPPTGVKFAGLNRVA